MGTPKPAQRIANIFRQSWPILALLGVCLAVGLAVGRDYGRSWDEAQIIQYGAESLKAYSPEQWMNGVPNVTNIPANLRYYGPAYFMAVQYAVYRLGPLLRGWPQVDLFHLVYFLTFIAGVYLFWRLALRFTSRAAAWGAAALFAAQPLLWGHAFINPKDLPFLVFFLASVESGLGISDAANPTGWRGWARSGARAVLAGLILGFSTSVRVIVPLAGLLVGFDLAWRRRGRSLPVLAVYGLSAAAGCLASWPFLWAAPVQRFLDSLAYMSRFPLEIGVLFDGRIVSSLDLPASYLPVFMATTLTLPALALALIGLTIGARRALKGEIDRVQFALLLVWVALPLGYVIAARPPLYDNARQFLFIYPPLFVWAGLGLDALQKGLERAAHGWGWPLVWTRLALGLLIAAALAPGLVGILRLHPYEYTYFNALVGGEQGAFRRYDQDYWLTADKEALEILSKTHPGAKVAVYGSLDPAAPYAANLKLVLYSAETLAECDYAVVPTRGNFDQSFTAGQTVFTVERAGAVFSLVKALR